MGIGIFFDSYPFHSVLFPDSVRYVARNRLETNRQSGWFGICRISTARVSADWHPGSSFDSVSRSGGGASADWMRGLRGSRWLDDGRWGQLIGGEVDGVAADWRNMFFSGTVLFSWKAGVKFSLGSVYWILQKLSHQAICVEERWWNIACSACL